MKMKCELTAQEVYEIVGKVLSEKGLKWSELNAKIESSMVFDAPDIFSGMTFKIETDQDKIPGLEWFGNFNNPNRIINKWI